MLCFVQINNILFNVLRVCISVKDVFRLLLAVVVLCCCIIFLSVLIFTPPVAETVVWGLPEVSVTISQSAAGGKEPLTDRTIRPQSHSHNNCIVHRQSSTPLQTSYGAGLRGWLDNALDCKCRGQGSTVRHDRAKDCFSLLSCLRPDITVMTGLALKINYLSSESTLVKTHACKDG